VLCGGWLDDGSEILNAVASEIGFVGNLPVSAHLKCGETVLSEFDENY